MQGISCCAFAWIGLEHGDIVVCSRSSPINVNTADAELLAELPGIGPSRAAAIIEERESNGDFADAQALTRVSGIGPATVENMQEQLAF
ncbi:ComEA family DNA-binding protein [Vreelandella rituensis]|uniref:ComEA family DNA-binding protein n=1 Tax=Vreelandella rituensis TaxID=2282306 RepID=A0A368U3I8_9GAMM|nr:ComEA family DNA-binding protein [Halomonas rituensis]